MRVSITTALLIIATAALFEVWRSLSVKSSKNSRGSIPRDTSRAKSADDDDKDNGDHPSETRDSGQPSKGRQPDPLASESRKESDEDDD